MQKVFFMTVLGFSASHPAYATNLFLGKGSSVDDSRNQACMLAEQAARLDAARQAESFVQKTVTSTFFESEKGLSKGRSEYIENTVYGTARLSGEPKQHLRILENKHIECTVEANYSIDSAAIQQHLLAEQARVSRQTEQQNAEAALLEELTANQKSYRDLQLKLPPFISGQSQINTFCDVNLSLPACENVIEEQLALPYLQSWSQKLGVPLELLQATTNLQGQTKLSAQNTQVNLADWQGNYQISLKLSDPKALRNKEIQQALRQLKEGGISDLNTTPIETTTTDSNENIWRASIAVGTDCYLCSVGSMRDWESLNKTENAAVKGNFVQASWHLASWISLNAGLYGEYFALCEQEGRGKTCATLSTDSATYPALGATLRYNKVYFEMMHLIASKEVLLNQTKFSESYQRFEFGVNSDITQQGWFGAAGISFRLLPKQQNFSWNDTWDINLKLGYIF